MKKECSKENIPNSLSLRIHISFESSACVLNAIVLNIC